MVTLHRDATGQHWITLTNRTYTSRHPVAAGEPLERWMREFDRPPKRSSSRSTPPT